MLIGKRRLKILLESNVQRFRVLTAELFMLY